MYRIEISQHSFKCKTQLEGTHRVQTHAVLLLALTLTLTLTFDLSTQNYITCRISYVHSLHKVWILWDHSFLSYVPDISVKNALTDPVTLTFEPQNSTTSRVSHGHSLYQIWTFWDHSFLSYASDKQTDRQANKQTNRRMDSKILPTLTDIVSNSVIF